MVDSFPTKKALLNVPGRLLVLSLKLNENLF